MHISRATGFVLHVLMPLSCSLLCACLFDVSVKGPVHRDAGCAASDSDASTCAAPTPDCAGVPGGTAFVDGCDQCVGGDTGKKACGRDCSQQFGGSAYQDHCGRCVSGTTGRDACTTDCHGDWGGTAAIDPCGKCTGGSTGQTACSADCSGTFGGSAALDMCGVCAGGNTGRKPCVQDCNGTWGGSAVFDNCNQCSGGTTDYQACVQDCGGNWGGTAHMNMCNECIADSRVSGCKEDCNGTADGPGHFDACGVCVGESYNAPCIADCHGDLGGTAELDACGKCVGGNTGARKCLVDCHGDPGGTAALDECNKCVGGKTGLSACAARTCTVGDTHDTVQKALDDTSCDRIDIGQRNVHEHLTVSRSVFIHGSGSAQTVLDGQGAGTVLTVSGAFDVQLSGLSITGGKADQGAGIHAQGANLHLSNVRVHNNELNLPDESTSVELVGAGIYVSGGMLFMSDVTIADNSCADCSGTGVFARDAQLRLQGTTISGNQIRAAVYGDGAALMASRGTLWANDSRFDGNIVTAKPDGGHSTQGAGLVLDDMVGLLDHCTINKNQVLGDIDARATVLAMGGAVDLTVRATAIRENVLDGASAEEFSFVTISHSTGLGRLVFDDVSIEANKVKLVDTTTWPVPTGGGFVALSLANTSSVLNAAFTHLRIRSNEIQSTAYGFHGGLLRVLRDQGTMSVRLTESELSDNQVSAPNMQGGAIYASGNWELGPNSPGSPPRLHLTVERSLIASNHLTIADSTALGGSLIEAANAEIILQNTTVDGNTITGGTDVATVARGFGQIGRVSLVQVTATDNVATNGLGRGQPLMGRVLALGTVFSGNTGALHHKCAHAATLLVLEGAGNWYNDPQECDNPEPDPYSILSGDPKLDPLADNGGYTRSRLPAADSELVNHNQQVEPTGMTPCGSDWYGLPAPVFDQRGYPRPVGGFCDIGSLEVR